MFKHSKVLNLSPQIRQGGDENKVSYKNFRKLASNLASTTRKARAREVVKVDCVVVFLLFSYFVFLANETCLVFGFHQLLPPRRRFCKCRGRAAAKIQICQKGEVAKIQICQRQKFAPWCWHLTKKWSFFEIFHLSKWIEVSFENLLSAFQSGRLQPLGGILPLRGRGWISYLGGRRSCQVEPPADCQGIRGGCWDHQEARSSNSRRGPPPGRAACLAIQVKGEDGRQPTSHEESKPTSHGEGGSQPTGERRSWKCGQATLIICRQPVHLLSAM